MPHNGDSVNLERTVAPVGRPHGGQLLINARIASASGLSPRDGHALAGFVDAEASFAIRPTNAGQNWSCGFSLVQRDDDTPVLAEFQRLTGLGRLRARKVVRNSRSQTLWLITSKAECQQLAALLTQFPLRGRKRREFEVWAEAIRIWRSVHRSSCGRWMDLAHAAVQLRALRRYVDPPRSIERASVDPHELVWYLGGFFTGEGTFYLGQDSARATVRLRRDDRPLLELLASTTASAASQTPPRMAGPGRRPCGPSPDKPTSSRRFACSEPQTYVGERRESSMPGAPEPPNSQGRGRNAGDGTPR
jgi:hypothetical protein